MFNWTPGFNYSAKISSTPNSSLPLLARRLVQTAEFFSLLLSLFSGLPLQALPTWQPTALPCREEVSVPTTDSVYPEAKCTVKPTTQFHSSFTSPHIPPTSIPVTQDCPTPMTAACMYELRFCALAHTVSSSWKALSIFKTILVVKERIPAQISFCKEEGIYRFT